MTMRWLEKHGNHYLYEGDDSTSGVGAIFNRGVPFGWEWKTFRKGLAPTLERAKELTEASSWSFLAFLERRWEWGQETFGPGKRTQGIIEHIRKELREIEADPTDLEEWIDVINLGIDGFNRHGGSCADLIRMLEAKHQKNENRTWPDWRGRTEDEAIEHVRT